MPIGPAISRLLAVALVVGPPVAFVPLAGCSGDGTDDAPVGASDDGTGGGADAGAGTGEIAGLWNASYAEFDEVDIVYVEITADGRWTRHDYEGDAFDGGGNCYSSIAYRVERVAGDRYRIEGPGEFETGREAVARRVGPSLRIAFADDGGDVEGSAVEVWPALDGLSPLDFEPCRAASASR